MLIHALAVIVIKIPLTNVGYERPQWLSHFRWFTKLENALPTSEVEQLVYPSIGEHSRWNPIIWSPATVLECGLMMATSKPITICLYLLHYIDFWLHWRQFCFLWWSWKVFILLHYTEIWLHWCQHFGHGSIGTKFSVRVLWWQWEKSIGVKILAMDCLKIKIK